MFFIFYLVLAKLQSISEVKIFGIQYLPVSIASKFVLILIFVSNDQSNFKYIKPEIHTDNDLW
jgi:hypothetical protein